MKPEPLDLSNWGKEFSVSKKALNNLRRRLKSAYNFYFIYQSEINLFLRDYPEYKEVLFNKVLIGRKTWDGYFEEEVFNDWLLKFSFNLLNKPKKSEVVKK